MAKMTAQMPDDIIDNFRKLSKKMSDEIAPKMAQGGAEVLAETIRANTEKHSRTGDLARSVTVGKPKKGKGDIWRCSVYFKGKSNSVQGDDGAIRKRKNPVSNSSIAMHLEYGTSNQAATPIVRTALESSKSKIEGRMRYEFKHGVEE